jgi:hypothetical protein
MVVVATWSWWGAAALQLYPNLRKKWIKFMKISLLLISFWLASSAHFAAASTQETTSGTQNKTTPSKEITYTARHVWDAKVEIGDVTELGATKHGTRRMIPITGGSFSGENIKGIVLPGGADFQLTRADGDTEFEARYMLKTHDGVAIHVTNRVLFHTPKTENNNTQPYLRSVIELEAPSNSAYDYLNHAIFMGTLEVPAVNPGEKPYVIIGVYQLL